MPAVLTSAPAIVWTTCRPSCVVRVVEEIPRQKARDSGPRFISLFRRLGSYQQRFESRVGAQIVKPGVHIKHSKSYAAVIYPLSQPEEGLIFIAEAYVGYRKVESINMFALCQTL